MQGETAKIVNNAEEEKALGPGWFDSPAKAPDREAEQAEIRRGYRESFKAAVNNPAEQVRIHFEYKTLHPKVAAADDSWNSEVTLMIPALQNQEALERADARQVEDQERRAIEAKATARLAAATAQPSAPTVANGGGREREAATKKSRRGNDRKGDPTLLDGKGRVTFRTAEEYLGINERQRQNLVKSGALSVEGQGNNRKITTQSLKNYLPPENPK